MKRICLVLCGQSHDGAHGSDVITDKQIKNQFAQIESAFPSARREGIHILHNRTSMTILDKLAELENLPTLGDYDLVVFYYYGHGLRVRVPDGTGHQTRWHHALSCARPPQTSAGAHYTPAGMNTQDFILSAQISDALGRIQRRVQVWAIVESCYAAGAIKSANTATATVSPVAQRRSRVKSVRRSLAAAPDWYHGARMFRLFASSFLHTASTGLAASVAAVSRMLGDSFYSQSFGELAQLIRLHRMHHLFPPPMREVSWPTYAGPLGRRLCEPVTAVKSERPRGVIGVEVDSFEDPQQAPTCTVDLGSVHGVEVGTKLRAILWSTKAEGAEPLEVTLSLTDVGTTYARAELHDAPPLPAKHHWIGLAQLQVRREMSPPKPVGGHTSLELRETSKGLSFELRSSARHIVFATLIIETAGRFELLNRWEPHGIAIAPNITTRIGLHWRDPRCPAITREDVRTGESFVHVIVTRAPISLCQFFPAWTKVVPHEPVPSEPRPPLLYEDDGSDYVCIRAPLVVTPALAEVRTRELPALHWSEDEKVQRTYLLPWRDRIERWRDKPAERSRVLLIVSEAHGPTRESDQRIFLTLVSDQTQRTVDLTEYAEFVRAINAVRERDPASGRIPKCLRYLLNWAPEAGLNNLQLITSAAVVEVWTTAHSGRAATDLRDLPWELVEVNGSYAMQGREVIRRILRLGHAAPRQRLDSGRLLRVMFMAAEPRSSEELETSARQFPPLNPEAEEQALQAAARGGKLALHVEASGSLEGLRIQQEGLRAAGLQPGIFHISCHGRTLDGNHLCLEARREIRPLRPAQDSEAETTECDVVHDLRYYTTLSAGEVVDADQIAANIDLYGRVFFLSSCNSGGRSLGTTLAAELVCAGASAAIGWAGEVSDFAATAFATEFYRAIARGASLEDGVRTARSHLSYNNMFVGQWHLPRLYLSDGVEGKLVTDESAESDRATELRHRIGVAGPELEHMIPAYDQGLTAYRRPLQMVVRLLRDPTIRNGLVLRCSDEFDSPTTQRQLAHRLGWVLGEYDCVMLDGNENDREALLERLGHAKPEGDLVRVLGRSRQQPVLFVWSNVDRCLHPNHKLRIDDFRLFDELIQAIRATPSAKAILLSSSPIAYRYPTGQPLAEHFTLTSTFAS